jgi:uncharacterized protein
LLVERYQRRVVDDDLDELLVALPAIALEGPKGVGKTLTATQRARSIERLDVATARTLMETDPGRLARLSPPVLIDEWQRFPPVWDLVRREVDDHQEAGRFLLTGSATPTDESTHSGAGRIVRLRMRPMSLAERSLAPPSVSLGELLRGGRPSIKGDSIINIDQYTDEIVRSGFPGIRAYEGRLLRLQLDGYLDRIVDSDLRENGTTIRHPDALKSWFRAYAAATSTDASYNSILDAATPGESAKPASETTARFRNALLRLWLLDPLPGWVPGLNELGRLAAAPKHHLADPALAVRLLGLSNESLLSSATPSHEKYPGPLLGAMFESLVALSIRVYASRSDANVFHFRTRNGDKEVDFIIEGPDRRVVALECKLSAAPTDADVRHLHWLKERLGDRLADMGVVTTGKHAYRRSDGVAVIPAALLGP